MSNIRAFTPREVVSELDRYIVGQHRAKKAVAIALRNRWRRQHVAADLRDEIAPKNIILMGPTGCGKTEIARRLAKLANAPFIKVEASKFTEVGYVGRDVDSMVRDLVENAVQLVRAEELRGVEHRAKDHAEERLIRVIALLDTAPPPPPAQRMPGPLGAFFMQPPAPPPAPSESVVAEIRAKLRAGGYDDTEVELDVAEGAGAMPFMQILGPQGGDPSQLSDLFSNLPGMAGRTKRRRMKVPDARKVLETEEAQKLIDPDRVQREAVKRTEEAGIVFLDEIDKIASRQNAGGADVSREGVQRDLLPIVEGSTVSTKYGPVRTDHVLFIAAGAFHVSKVSDLIPELQGRFPIRVELEPLVRADFVRILTEPKNALTKQYRALLETEGVRVEMTEDAIDALAEYAEKANERAENIGARRLHTVLEALFEDLSFKASEMGGEAVTIDAERVRATLAPILANDDLARYIL
jgi:ATP-dependent HslUV protease ATP-binding subunit HslU